MRREVRPAAKLEESTKFDVACCAETWAAHKTHQATSVAPYHRKDCAPGISPRPPHKSVRRSCTVYGSKGERKVRSNGHLQNGSSESMSSGPAEQRLWDFPPLLPGKPHCLGLGLRL